MARLNAFCVVLFAFIFSSSGQLCAQCNSNDPKAPCFSNNSDILDGRTALLADDDLVLNGLVQFETYGTQVGTTGGDFPTANSTFLQGTSSIFGGIGTQPTSNFIEVVGQMFTQTSPQTVSAVSAGSWGQGNAFLEGLNGQTVTIPEMQSLVGSSQLYGASGDFLGNGVDQMVVVALRLEPPVQKIVFQALAAKDPNHYTGSTSDFQVGAMSGGVNNASRVYAITSGVFSNRLDGQPKPLAQVAVVSGNPSTGNGLTLALYGMTSNLGFTTGKSINLNLPEGNVKVQSMAIASGRFAGNGHDQLVIMYAGPVGDTARLISVDFDANGNPVQLSGNNYGFNNSMMLPYQNDQYGGAVWLAKARFNWFGTTDQLAYTIATGGIQAGSRTGILTFDQNMKPTLHKEAFAAGAAQCHFGLAAGRFDRMQSNPNPPPSQIPDPTPQLSDMTSDCTASGGNVNFNIYNVLGPTSDYGIRVANAINIGNGDDPPVYPATSGQVPTALTMAIGPGDLQGRSLLLGPPEKAIVSGHIQPDTVLGVPPMHVDWITPAGGSTPEVLNVSVFPATFNTAYTFQSGQSGTVSRSGTTSYTAATKETASEKVSYGIPGLASVSVQSTQAASQLHQNTISKKFNTYAGQTSGFSTKTVFDDVVAATASQMNIYSYRVIGQCAASANAPASEGCPAGTRPVYIQFSGPDNVEYIQAAEGRNLEWYQPVQEPGNLLSYPANEQQLVEDLSGGTSFQPLTPTDNLWDSQTASAVVANWTVGSGNSVSSGTVSTHSFDASVSVSGGVSFDGFGASASAGFDYNTSSSTSTLNQSTSTVSRSQGITLNRGVGGGPISSSVYDYQGQSFIYGQTAPEGTIQTDATPSTTVKAQGYIAASHATDVLSQGAITSGNFWPQAYAQATDIALNHPQRWLQKTPSGVNPQQVQFNCPVGYTSSLSSPSCSSVNEKPTPANVADAPFYEMKGLFVTPGESFDGPQITKTALGTKVNLRARIYNYSLANFPAGAVMRVQFYAQPWGDGEFTSVPNNPSEFAPAIFLGEGTDVAGNTLPPVPAYCGGSGGGDPCLNSSVRNWEYAYASWDTSKNGVIANSKWKFWVLAWVELNGKLLAEIPDHGLSALPPSHYKSIGDVLIEPYSNNLGYYNQTFTVLASVGVSAAGQSGVKPSLILSNFGPRDNGKALRDHVTKLTARLRSSGADISAVHAYYYDGDPNRDGQLFDFQKIDAISSGHGVVDTANFTPKTCGPHWIYVRAVPLDGRVKASSLVTSVNVTVDPVPPVEGLIRYVQSTTLPIGLKQQLLDSLMASREAYRGGNQALGNVRLEMFKIAVQINRNQIPDDAETAIKAEIRDLQSCL
jgi:hypothetical protein